MRVLPTDDDDPTQNHVEWNVVEEGFRLLERDLRKLQVYLRHCALISVLTEIGILAICGDQRYRFQENTQKMGQTVEIGDEGALSRSSD